MSMYVPTYLWMYARMCRSRWSRVLRRSSTAAGLLRLWGRIPQGALMFVEGVMGWQVEGLCEELFIRPESPTDCGESCVIQTPQEWGGHGPRWATKLLKDVCMHVCVYACRYEFLHYIHYLSSLPMLLQARSLIQHRRLIIVAIKNVVQ